MMTDTLCVECGVELVTSPEEVCEICASRTGIVVSCHPDGTVETVLKDQLFDTREVFGVTSRKINRISEILPTEDGMRFYIRWLRGPLAGTTSQDTFASYETAVEAEVKAINAMRLSGTSFA